MKTSGSYCLRRRAAHDPEFPIDVIPKPMSVALIKVTLLVAGVVALGAFVLEYFTDRIDTEHTVWILQSIPFAAMAVILFLILAQRRPGA